MQLYHNNTGIICTKALSKPWNLCLSTIFLKSID